MHIEGYNKMLYFCISVKEKKLEDALLEIL